MDFRALEVIPKDPGALPLAILWRMARTLERERGAQQGGVVMLEALLKGPHCLPRLNRICLVLNTVICKFACPFGFGNLDGGSKCGFCCAEGTFIGFSGDVVRTEFNLFSCKTK
eukprot:1623091-Ditylum_brightwellii.AAC.1